MSKRKTVLVTGATSGVGFALSKKLLSEGFKVFATGRSISALLELEKEGAVTTRADLRDTTQLDALMKQVETPDIVVVSAGVGTFGFAHELSDEVLQQMIDVNVSAPLKLMRRLLPRMIERRSGHIIFIGSQAGKVSTPKASVYAASKHAILGYANAIRMEVASYEIAVTTVNPGPINTPFLDLADQTGSYRTALKKHLLEVDEVVLAIRRAIDKPVRDVNLPWYMGISSKLYNLFPSVVERLGKGFFFKK